MSGWRPIKSFPWARDKQPKLAVFYFPPYDTGSYTLPAMVKDSPEMVGVRSPTYWATIEPPRGNAT